MNAKWTILVVYEGAAARDPAMRFCDGLVQRFWPDFSCELSWFEWEKLAEDAQAEEAEGKATEADFIIVASAHSNHLPRHVQRWMEQAIRSRGDREGMLVGLTASEGSGPSEAGAIQLYLRKLAHAGGMDYVTAIPQSLPHSERDWAESCNQRATQMTSVLGAILNRAHFPPCSG